MGALIFTICGPISVVMGGSLGLAPPRYKLSAGAYEQARQTWQNSGGGELQRARQDLTKEWGLRDIFFNFYAKKLSLFRVSLLSD